MSVRFLGYGCRACGRIYRLPECECGQSSDEDIVVTSDTVSTWKSKYFEFEPASPDVGDNEV